MKTSLFVLSGIGMLMLNGCSAQNCPSILRPINCVSPCIWDDWLRMCRNPRESTEAATTFLHDEQQKGDYIKQNFDFDTPTSAPAPKIWGEAYASAPQGQPPITPFPTEGMMMQYY